MNAAESTAIPRPVTLAKVIPLVSDTALYCVTLPENQSDPFSFIPGQFVMLSVPGGGEFPVSPANPPRADNSLEFCVRQVGHVTALLDQTPPGSQLGIRGPFGNGFPLEEMEQHDILLLAGGLGIVPLRSLLLYLLGHRPEFGTITLLYGAREPAAMLFREELATLSRTAGLHLFLTVDFVNELPSGDFSCAIGLLPDLLQGTRFDPAHTYVAVCGPPPLYRCLMSELLATGVPAERIFLALERRMKCGVGRCCHCAVGGLFCCTDGPVFRYSLLQDIPEAL